MIFSPHTNLNLEKTNLSYYDFHIKTKGDDEMKKMIIDEIIKLLENSDDEELITIIYHLLLKSRND